MKKLNIFGKQISILLVFGLLVVGGASAALVTYFGQTTATMNVEQAVVVTGDTEQTFGDPDPITAGVYWSDVVEITNNADHSIELSITSNEEEGITTTYWGKHILENKDSEWNVINDDRSATLNFELMSSDFNYELKAEGLEVDTDYSLIYYADKPDRFVDWGGDNPGVLIVDGTSDADGNLVLSGNSVIGMDIPTSPDANMDEHNYCDSDNYDLCFGGKIWLVTSADYAEPALTAWNPSDYLFETDMVSYSNGESLPAYNGMTNMYIKYVLADNIAQGEYTITTTIDLEE